jgi:hypothetical protein
VTTLRVVEHRRRGERVIEHVPAGERAHDERGRLVEDARGERAELVPLEPGDLRRHVAGVGDDSAEPRDLACDARRHRVAGAAIEPDEA